MDEVFDQDKVDSIRREILEGRFPIDEERLAKKFRELEEELGNLGA
jgi:anti-sigma28 factor (negative regulator of flagellin synthesis)